MSPDRPDNPGGEEEDPEGLHLAIPERGSDEPDATENQKTIIRALFAELVVTDPSFVDPLTEVGKWQAWSIIEQIVSWTADEVFLRNPV